MKSLGRCLTVLVAVSAAIWGASRLVPPPPASLADEEQSGTLRRSRSFEPLPQSRWTTHAVPLRDQTRSTAARPRGGTLARPVWSPSRSAQPVPASVLVAGSGSASRATAVVSIHWGNPDQLIREIARIWPKLRVNPLQIRRGSQAWEENAAVAESGQEEAPHAPVLVATRPGRIYIVSDDPEALETLKAIVHAFRPTPAMQGLPIAARRLEQADATQLAEAIDHIVGSGLSQPVPGPHLGERFDHDSGPLSPLRNVLSQNIRIHADARSNTLIYQARPRDRSILERVLRRVEHSESAEFPESTPSDWDGPEPPNRGMRERGLRNLEPDPEPPSRPRVEELSQDERARILQRFAEATRLRRGRSARELDKADLPVDRDVVELPSLGQPNDAADRLTRGILVQTRRPQQTILEGDELLEPMDALPDAGGAGEPGETFLPQSRRLEQAPFPPATSLGAAVGRGPAPRIALQEPQEPPTDPAQQPDQQQAEQPAQQPAQPQAGAQAIQMGALRGEVQIEVIPELGIFLIQATSDEDAAEVERIIKQIEEISAGRAPVVEIVPLEHVQATALAAIINSIYSQMLTSRGLATAGQEVPVATSLVKPNALLLIAPGDDMEYLRGQIERLDQSAEPQMQFRSFRLEHAPAQILKEALDEFYADPTGLGTVVRVTAEPRSNTLVVQAAPNDMAEIAEWIRQIDVADSATINDLRIFRLRNANAADLAEILQEAILGVLSPASRAAGLGAVTGQAALAGGAPGVGGQTGAARLLQEATSSVLRFSVGDEQEQRELVSGILSEVRITAEPASNALIVSAPDKSMELIAAVITELDSLPETVASIQIFTLIHGDATNVATMLQTLFQAQGGAEQGPQAILQAAGPGAEGSTLVPLRFSVDRRTNTIIAVGNQSDLLTVDAIIRKLDTAEVIERQTQVFRLKNSPAQDIATAVNDLITAERTQLQGIDPDYVSAFEQLEREVIVVAEPVNNFLLISATENYFDKINLLVEELDKRPPQVAIQVLIAQVEIGDHDEFGIELGFQDSVLFDRSQILDPISVTTTLTQPNQVTQTTETIISALLNPGYNFNNQPLGNSGSAQSLMRADAIGPQGLTNFAMGRVNGELGFGGLVLSAGSENVSLLLRALRQFRRVDVLARPQIVTLDNQPGYIQVGARVPYIVSADISEVGQQNTIDFQDVGLIVQVTPRISPQDDVVTMVVDATRSEVGPESEGIPVSISASGDVVRSPQIPITRAQTTISARSGQTVIIGGLLTKDNTTVDRRVPILSDIPILGHAFRYDLDIERRQELLIILTPQVIRDDDDAELLKQVEARRMSWVLSDVVEMQGDIGVYEETEVEVDSHGHEHGMPDEKPGKPSVSPNGPLPEPPVPPAPQAKRNGAKVPSTVHAGRRPHASTRKPPGPLARVLSKWRWKPDYNGKTAKDWEQREQRISSREKARPAAVTGKPQSLPSNVGGTRHATSNPWGSTKDQTILPAARWQELEEIKTGERTRSTTE